MFTKSVVLHVIYTEMLIHDCNHCGEKDLKAIDVSPNDFL